MYITPRVLIQQEFLQLPVYREYPLPAFIIGPQFALTRYSEASEKPFTALATLDGEVVTSGNSYISSLDTRYDFPNIPAGGDVDPSYTKVYAESVEAQYFPLDNLGDLSNENVVSLVTAPSGGYYHNKVRFSNAALKTGHGYTRNSFFSNRDVHIGDVIQISGTVGDPVKAVIKEITAETADMNSALAAQVAVPSYYGEDGVTDGTNFTSNSAEFHSAEVVGKYITISHISGTPGVFKIIGCPDSQTLILDGSLPSATAREWSIGGVYNDIGNAAWQSAELSNAPVSIGTTNNTVSVSNATEYYAGYPALRIVEDTYTVRVTSTGTTSLSTVRFSVTSANGAFSIQEDVALDSGTLSVDTNDNNVVLLDFTEVLGQTASFVKGNTWTVHVAAAVDPVNPEASGDYTGATDITYTITVDRGGEFYDGNTNATTCARLLITASDVDTSLVVLPRPNISFNVGTHGVTASFASGSITNRLIDGDTYYIPCTAKKAGMFNVVEFSESLPATFLAVEQDLTAELFLTQKSIQIPEVRSQLESTVNWVQEATYITINADITTYDNNITDQADPARLPITEAKLFVEHRDLLQDNVVAIDSVRDLADVSTKLGTIHPDNPLAQGVYDAVLNAQNQIVYFLGVQTNDLVGYTQAIKISEKSDKVYSFVPMTFDRVIQDAIVSHVNAYSTPEVGRWRIAWLAVQDHKTSTIYDVKEDLSNYELTITDDPAVSNTQYKLVTIEGARFIEDGIRPNDTVRFNYRTSPDGKVIYDEYVVDHVRTNTTLTITKPLKRAITIPVKCQLVRNYTKSERAYNIAHIGGDYNNRRVRMVFPDTYKYGSITKQGYFAAAGLAGLRSGVVPHQGLTNSEFLGADDLHKVVVEFTQDDLNTMAEQGIWLITQEVIGATPYVRHQLTTDERSLNTSEDSITTNVDSISYALKHTLTPFIGRYNINPENILAVRDAIANELMFRATSTWTARAGNQLVSFSLKDDILKIQQNPTYKDRIDVEVRLNVPYPMNYISLKLIVG